MVGMQQLENAARYIIIPVADLEAGNFPAVIAGSDVYTNSSKTLADVTLLHGKGNISATTADATLSRRTEAGIQDIGDI